MFEVLDLAEGDEANRLSFLVHRLAEANIDWKEGESEARAILEKEQNCAKCAAGWVALEQIQVNADELEPFDAVGKAVNEPNGQRALTTFMILERNYGASDLVTEAQQVPKAPTARQLASMVERLPPTPASAHFLGRFGNAMGDRLMRKVLENAAPAALSRLLGVAEVEGALARLRVLAAEPAPVVRREAVRQKKPAGSVGKAKKASKARGKFDRYLEALASGDREKWGRVLANMFDGLKAIPPSTTNRSRLPSSASSNPPRPPGGRAP